MAKGTNRSIIVMSLAIGNVELTEEIIKSEPLTKQVGEELEEVQEMLVPLLNWFILLTIYVVVMAALLAMLIVRLVVLL